MSNTNKFIVFFMLAQAFINYKYAYGFTCVLLIVCVALILCQQFIYSPWAIRTHADISKYKADTQRQIKALMQDLADSKKETEFYRSITKKSLGQCDPKEYQHARDEWISDQNKKKNGK